MADTIPTKLIVNGEEMILDAHPTMTVLVHPNGVRVDAPEFVEINSRKTIECMEKMNQHQWQHISTGELFQILFRELFPIEDDSVRGHATIEIPASIEKLKGGDFGVMHGAGMIVLACEAMFAGKTKLFFRTPEDHLHPATERRIASMFKKMQQLLGGSGVIAPEE